MKAKTPLDDYTKSMTWLECTIVETYHLLEECSKRRIKTHHLPCEARRGHSVLKEEDSKNELGELFARKIQSMLQKDGTIRNDINI